MLYVVLALALEAMTKVCHGIQVKFQQRYVKSHRKLSDRGCPASDPDGLNGILGVCAQTPDFSGMSAKPVLARGYEKQ